MIPSEQPITGHEEINPEIEAKLNECLRAINWPAEFAGSLGVGSIMQMEVLTPEGSTVTIIETA